MDFGDPPKNPPARIQDSFRIRSSEADPHGRVTVRTLLLLMQETATTHAKRLGVAVDALIEQGVAWVLSRLHVEMASWPRANDDIAIETWPSAASRLVVERRFHISTPEGEEIGNATSLWIVFDIERRRPIRLPSVLVGRFQDLVGDDRATSPQKIPPVEIADIQRSFEVRYADLDMVHHVNNAAYAQWLTETTPPELWSTRVPAELDVAYLAECRLGDTVLSEARQVGGGQFLHRLRRRSDGADVVRALTRWRPSQ